MSPVTMPTTFLGSLNPQPSPSYSSVDSVFKRVLPYLATIGQMLVSPVYALLDSGIANVLGLEILRHGTSFPNYVSIIQTGADPSLGGSDRGSGSGIQEFGRQNFRESSKNYFHVFRDSTILHKTIIKLTNAPCWILEKCAKRVALCVGPKLHAILSGYATIPSQNAKNIMVKIQKIAHAILGFFTPTLRFKFTPEQVKTLFEIDPDYTGLAYRTREKIDVTHLGITGSLAQGLNSGLIKRITARPFKAILGLAQITAAVAITVFSIGKLPIR